MADDLLVAGAVKVRAGLLGERAGARRIAVGDREKAHRRVLGGQPRAQRPDAPGADDRDADGAGGFHFMVSTTR